MPPSCTSVPASLPVNHLLLILHGKDTCPVRPTCGHTCGHLFIHTVKSVFAADVRFTNFHVNICSVSEYLRGIALNF